MANFNRDDVDFDVNNLRLDEDLWTRQVRENNGYPMYGRNQLERNCIPVDGDRLIDEKMNDPKVTQTLEQFYNKTKKADDF